MDIMIVFYIDTGNLTPMQREHHLKTTRDHMPKHDRIEYYFIGSDRNDVKVIPIKCYLDGVVPETPDSIEDLVRELRELITPIDILIK